MVNKVQQGMIDAFDLDASGSMVPRSLEAKLGESVSVKDFGAVGDGVADDTAAFNALTAYIRTLFESGAGGNNIFNVNVVIPPGNYSVSSWNLTELLGRSVCISGYGASIIGRSAGKVVVDCIGSRWLRINGLKVRGLSTTVPLCGIQVGPKGTETCGNNTFNDVECLGYYSRAAFANLGSETTQYFGCTFQNQQVGGEYAFIGDGLTRYIPQSDYATVTRTVQNTALSFTNNSFYSSQARNEGGGDAVFLANTSGWTFDRNTYFLTFNAAAVRLYGTTAFRNLDLRIDGLFESEFDDTPSPGNIGIRWALALDGDGSGTAVDGLVINSMSPHCEVSLIHQVTASTYRLSNVQLRVQNLKQVGATFFSNAAGLIVDGTIDTRDAGKLNLDALATFNGSVRVNSFASMGKPASGSCHVFDTGSDAQYLIGDQNGNTRVYFYNAVLFAEGAAATADFKGRAKSTGLCQFGNEILSSALQVTANSGAIMGINAEAQAAHPRLLPVGANADADLQLAGKGTGVVRYGTFTSNADAPITGYITIKDAGGTVRKLAIIA